jgi:ATP-dependent protease ClpP protease subunit
MAELIAEHTGQTKDQIEKDSDRDRWFSAEEAKEYGFVDHVFSSAAQAGGAKGKRFALPNARILIHQPALEGGMGGQASDIEIQANEVLRMRTWLEETWAKHSGRTPEQVRNDIERDKILSAEEAKEYGLIDEVLASRKGTLED